MNHVHIYATLKRASLISHSGIIARACVCVCGGGWLTHKHANLSLCEHSNSSHRMCIGFRRSHLSLQLAWRHGQTEGWLLAKGPGHQQTFILHLLQTHHHLIESESTLPHMERHHSHRNAVRIYKKKEKLQMWQKDVSLFCHILNQY